MPLSVFSSVPLGAMIYAPGSSCANLLLFEPPQGKINKMIFALSEDSDQRSEFSLRAQWVAKDLSFLHADSEDSCSEWADAKADLSLRWAHVILLVLLS